MTTVKLEYYACFGRGDYSDTIEWDFDLTDEEYAAYRQVIENETDFEDNPLLQAVLDRALQEIFEAEADNIEDDDCDITVRFAEEYLDNSRDMRCYFTRRARNTFDKFWCEHPK